MCGAKETRAIGENEETTECGFVDLVENVAILTPSCDNKESKGGRREGGGGGGGGGGRGREGAGRRERGRGEGGGGGR